MGSVFLFLKAVGLQLKAAYRRGTMQSWKSDVRKGKKLERGGKIAFILG